MFSLVYFNIKDDAATMKRLKWLSFYEEEPTWDADSSIYFRFKPSLVDWVQMMLMVMLNMINYFFLKPNQVKFFSVLCYESIRDRYSKVMFKCIRI